MLFLKHVFGAAGRKASVLKPFTESPWLHRVTKRLSRHHVVRKFIEFKNEKFQGSELLQISLHQSCVIRASLLCLCVCVCVVIADCARSINRDPGHLYTDSYVTWRRYRPNACRLTLWRTKLVEMILKN